MGNRAPDITGIIPIVRSLDGGVRVVDYGAIWFRISPDGKVTKKVATVAGVIRRAATKRECRAVDGVLAASRGTDGETR